MSDIELDLIVVGGGILGTFHAYHALKKGLRVCLLEKDNTPNSATVRNFGQVVPSGMGNKWQKYGRESLHIYKKIQSKFDISVRQEGSIYIASNEDEMQLLEELRKINIADDYSSLLLNRRECLRRYPGLKQNYVKGGLFFPQEITIEPGLMISRLHHYLKKKGLQIYYNTQVVECNALNDKVSVHNADGSNFIATKTIICNGSDFKILYPDLFLTSDIEIVKLQMLRTKPQINYKLPGSVLTGLSIRRYESFAECPSFATIKAKESADTPEKKWGIHILFKQAIDGSVILGDSHEYSDVENMDSLGFGLNMDIDRFILTRAKEIFELPTYEIEQRWYGIYSQIGNSDIFQATVDRNIHIVTGIGGKGMTTSAGFSKVNINQLFNC